MSTRKKIALIGAGNIGGELAALVARKELGDVVLFDIPQKADFAKGKALDLEQNSAVLGYDAKITGTGDWKDCAGAATIWWPPTSRSSATWRTTSRSTAPTRS